MYEFSGLRISTRVDDPIGLEALWRAFPIHLRDSAPNCIQQVMLQQLEQPLLVGTVSGRMWTVGYRKGLHHHAFIEVTDPMKKMTVADAIGLEYNLALRVEGYPERQYPGSRQHLHVEPLEFPYDDRSHLIIYNNIHAGRHWFNGL